MRYREEDQDKYLQSFDVLTIESEYSEILPDNSIIKLIHNRSENNVILVINRDNIFISPKSFQNVDIVINSNTVKINNYYPDKGLNLTIYYTLTL
jgi:hypothetical protein